MSTPDAQAWKNNPKHQFVYNKLWLAKDQGLKAAPCPVEPPSYPVFYKPIYGLYSMGLGAFRADEPVDSNNEKPGLFWMEYLEGTHWTFNAYCEDGSLEKAIGLMALKDNDQFEAWIPMRPRLSIVGPWAAKHLSGYHGFVNFEGIGEHILECHLRQARQIKYVYPDNYPCPSQPASGCIVPVFGEDWKRYELNEDFLDAIDDEFVIHPTLDNGYGQQTLNHEARLGYVVGRDLDRTMKAARMYKECILSPLG